MTKMVTFMFLSVLKDAEVRGFVSRKLGLVNITYCVLWHQIELYVVDS